MKKLFQILLLWAVLLFLILVGCDPLVTQFDPVEEAVLYQANHPFFPLIQVDTLTVMTWNIRFAAGRYTPWFGDSCGDRVLLSESEVLVTLEKLAEKINVVKPDILLLQEVDVKSKRTAYIDEVQWLLNHTYLNYAAYASSWQAQMIPSDGLGRMDMGNAILSRWPILEHERIQLPQRGDQDALTRYFYLQRNFLKTRIALPGHEDFFVINLHADAFSTDDTKRKHIERFKEELDKLDGEGALFIAGGDFNMLPPRSDSTDFCDEDRCSGESFHHANDKPFHKEGSCYTPEKTWLQPLYDAYKPDIPPAQFYANQRRYFTHTTDRSAFWDRKLDYLFTNTGWLAQSVVTHQDFLDISDHAPVSAKWGVPK
jgi:endonuclease/exonuclease/phosphatase family metal-dependent hydrolase